MTDILIYESRNGGEISLKNGDIEMTDGLLNMPYLAHFGGNLEASTRGDETDGEERFDWWGNLFLETKAQMNSSLERTLNTVPITSSGGATLEREAKKDLEFLNSISSIEISASLKNNNELKLSEKINQNVVNFLWNATKNELIEEIVM